MRGYKTPKTFLGLYVARRTGILPGPWYYIIMLLRSLFR